jgi:hypothetical protein
MSDAETTNDGNLLSVVEHLQEALEGLLGMPMLCDFKDSSEEQLQYARENGFAPEIQEDAEALLRARAALRSADGVIKAFE